MANCTRNTLHTVFHFKRYTLQPPRWTHYTYTKLYRTTDKHYTPRHTTRGTHISTALSFKRYIEHCKTVHVLRNKTERYTETATHYIVHSTSKFKHYIDIAKHLLHCTEHTELHCSANPCVACVLNTNLKLPNSVESSWGSAHCVILFPFPSLP